MPQRRGGRGATDQVDRCDPPQHRGNRARCGATRQSRALAVAHYGVRSRILKVRGVGQQGSRDTAQTTVLGSVPAARRGAGRPEFSDKR